MDYRKCAAGGAVLLWKPGRPSPVGLLQNRSETVGKGLGLSAGGFCDLDSLYEKPIGCTVDWRDEIMREVKEELPHLADLGSDFVQRMRAGLNPIAQLIARTGDRNEIHACAYYEFRLAPNEFDHIVKGFRPNEEVESLLEAPLHAVTREAMHHPHEWTAIEMFLAGRARGSLGF